MQSGVWQQTKDLSPLPSSSHAASLRIRRLFHTAWRGRELSAQVQTYWSNFARYGSPNAPAAHQQKPTRNGSAVDVLEWPVASPRGAETSFSQCHCQAKKRIFVKTGSGQSHGKLKRKEVSLQEVLEEERCGSR